MDVVVVESPSKAKTIGRYLGGRYHVLASFGHVRDLAAKDGSVLPHEDFRMVWDVLDKSKRNLATIASSLQKASTLYLATDPDREGEAISWHLLKALEEMNMLSSIAIKRVVFHEVTQQAVLEAFSSPRSIDVHLVDAYLARRALDYLVGFTLSPLLWRKLPGSRSAGRVQSVALRMICEREAAIESFKPQAYWFVDAKMETAKKEPFQARLYQLRGDKVDRFAFDAQSAAEARDFVTTATWRVAAVEAKKEERHPRPSFTTSTLQQEAARKLGFSAKRTMQTAQKLYDGSALRDGQNVGLITYMRTDSHGLSAQAVTALRSVLLRVYGDAYVPAKARVYKGKVKNAQEAHEAIRPTDFSRPPSQLKTLLDDDCYRLYDLIWKRTLASQMASAVFERMRVDITDGVATKPSLLRARGAFLLFDGFLSVYEEGEDDKSSESDDTEQDARLPSLAKGHDLRVIQAEASEHFTKPPPRFTEASLVKALEEHGIGRPSTYAAIISVLQERFYVYLENRRFKAETKGRVVTLFLDKFFHQYIQNDFTAGLENQLDAIARGELPWKHALAEFWREFIKAIEDAKALTTREIIDILNESLKAFLFGDDDKNRVCPQCSDGALMMKLSRYGPFVGCSRYPECRYTRAFSSHEEGAEGAQHLAAQVLGAHPDGGSVSLRDGPYGPYIQLDRDEDGKKPKRVSLNKTGYSPQGITLATALGLLSLPRVIGKHPQTGKDMIVGNGPYGPYVRHDTMFASLQPDDDLLSIGDNRAVELLALAEEKRRARIIDVLGVHPDDGADVTLEKSRFGPCVVHGKTRAYLGKGGGDNMTLEKALERLALKKQKDGGGKKLGKKKTTKRKSHKKPQA